MSKNIFHKLLKMSSMNMEEFAVESGIDIKELNRYNNGSQIYDTSLKITEYFKKSDKRYKKIVEEFMGKYEKRHVEKTEIFNKLQILLCNDIYRKFCFNKSGILKNDGSMSFCQTYSGQDAILFGLENFLDRAMLLSNIEKSVIAYNKVKLIELGIYSDVMSLLADADKKKATAMTILEWNEKDVPVLQGCTPNHFLFQIYPNQNSSLVYSILFFDHSRANSFFYLDLKRLYSKSAENIKKSPTRIAYLLNRLQIDNATLSNTLFIDKTLISKWRSGKRKQKSYHELTVKLADYIYTADKNYNLIRPLMNAYYIHEFRNEEYRIKFLLRNWLFYDDIYVRLAFCEKMDNAVNSSILTYSSKESFAKAVKYVFQYCKNINHCIHMVCFDNIKLLFSINPSIVETIKKNFTITLRADFVVSNAVKHILNNISNGVNVVNIVLRKILHNTIVPFIYYDFSYFGDLQFLMVVKDTIALEVSKDKHIKDKFITNIHFNKDIVNNFYNLSQLKQQEAVIVAVEIDAQNFEIHDGNDVFIVSNSRAVFPFKSCSFRQARHIIVASGEHRADATSITSEANTCFISEKPNCFAVNCILKYNHSFLIFWDNVEHVLLIRDKYIVNLFYGILIYQWNMLSENKVI